jgi:UDPglucose--hexose-1-phosphate uridylyltransferase
MYDAMNAIGAHEILVEAPEHDRHWAALEVSQIERVLRACRHRILDLRNDARFRQVIWVKTHGLPTHLFQHPHSHILASPFIPTVIEEELKGFGSYLRWKERCVLCDMIKQESADGRRIVLREGAVLAFTPYAARFPYETWIVPTEHGHDFGMIRSSVLRDLARVLRGTLGRLREVLTNPPFSAVLHSSPVGEFVREEYHWHLELLPRPPQVLDLEWGAWIYINPVPPEVAAARLRMASG